MILKKSGLYAAIPCWPSELALDSYHYFTSITSFISGSIFLQQLYIKLRRQGMSGQFEHHCNTLLMLKFIILTMRIQMQKTGSPNSNHKLSIALRDRVCTNHKLSIASRDKVCSNHEPSLCRWSCNSTTGVTCQYRNVTISLPEVIFAPSYLVITCLIQSNTVVRITLLDVLKNETAWCFTARLK